MSNNEIPLRLYWAAPLFTPEQIAFGEEVRDTLESRTFHIGEAKLYADLFMPRDAAREIWGDLSPAEATAAQRKAVLKSNRNAIQNSDIVVAWIRGTGGPFTDQGVVWEMGYANAIYRPVIGLVRRDEWPARNVNLMLAESLATVVSPSGLRSAIISVINNDTYWLRDSREQGLTHEGSGS